MKFMIGPFITFGIALLVLLFSFGFSSWVFGAVQRGVHGSKVLVDGTSRRTGFSGTLGAQRLGALDGFWLVFPFGVLAAYLILA